MCFVVLRYFLCNVKEIVQIASTFACVAKKNYMQ